MKNLIINHAIKKHLNSASYKTMMRESPGVFTDPEIEYRLRDLIRHNATAADIETYMRLLPYRAKYHIRVRRELHIELVVVHFYVTRYLWNWFQKAYFAVRSFKITLLGIKYKVLL